MFQPILQQIEAVLPWVIVGFVLGVGLATWLFLVVASGLKPLVSRSRHKPLDCNERFE